MIVVSIRFLYVWFYLLPTFFGLVKIFDLYELYNL